MEMINFWDSIEIGCMKRVSEKHNLFWAKDYNGSLAFIIELEHVKKENLPLIKITGMQVVYKELNGIINVYLVLKNINDIDIFKQICLDIINIIEAMDYKISADLIVNRLKQWQNFLSSHRDKSFSIEKQIGLFGELYFLYDKLFPLIGVTKAILSWVGPNKDKQDFRFKKLNIEVKSYLDNKRGIVNISSLEQLNPSNGDLYLYVYGMKIDENGVSLDEFIKLIREQIVKDESTELEYFDQLVEEYGFFDGYEYENLLKFEVFEEKMYRVDDTFPKLPLSIKREEIKSIKYTIDISLCNDFLIHSDDLNVLKEER